MVPGEEEEQEEEEDAKQFRLFFSELCALSPTDADGVAKAGWDAGDVMRLPSSHLFGDPGDIRYVYVRQCYIDLASMFMQKDSGPEDVAKAVLLGTPGIGNHGAQPRVRSVAPPTMMC